MLDRDLHVLARQYSLFTTVHTDNAYNVTESNLSFPIVKSRILTTEDLEIEDITWPHEDTKFVLDC